MNRFKQTVTKHAKALIAALLCVPLSVIAFFNDLEQAQQQLFTAGEIMLTLDVTDNELLVGVGESEVGAREVQIELSEKTSSAQYEVVVVDTNGDDEWCDKLQLKSDFGGVVTIGSLKNFAVGPHTTTGVWQFDVPSSLHFDETVPHGATCTATMEVEAWQASMSKSTGYHHRETFMLVFKSSQIVLNEVLAQPDTNAPEFIELYNNGSEDVDVAGWTIEEWTSSGATTSHTIASLGEPKSNLIAYDGSGSTVVPAGGFLALRFAANQQYLNNNGDTITLYDAAGRQLDSYTYEKAKVKMSDARVPDGTGDWVDPIPTPGEPNVLETATLTELSIKLSGIATESGDGSGENGEEETASAGELEPTIGLEGELAGEEYEDLVPDSEQEGEEVMSTTLEAVEEVEQDPELPIEELVVEPGSEESSSDSKKEVISSEEEPKQPEEADDVPEEVEESEPEPAITEDTV